MIASGRLRVCLVVLSAFLLASEACSQPSLVVALGDSNTAGFGVGREQPHHEYLICPKRLWP
jgi:hypothetical protein